VFRPPFALTTPASLEERAMQLICAFGSLRGQGDEGQGLGSAYHSGHQTLLDSISLTFFSFPVLSLGHCLNLSTYHLP
jgi:hypothetical protein